MQPMSTDGRVGKRLNGQEARRPAQCGPHGWPRGFCFSPTPKSAQQSTKDIYATQEKHHPASPPKLQTCLNADHRNSPIKGGHMLESLRECCTTECGLRMLNTPQVIPACSQGETESWPRGLEVSKTSKRGHRGADQ